MSKLSYELFRGELMGAKMLTALHALSIAKEAHEGVFRKDGVTPYIEHPMKVASILYDLGAPEEAITAALLHDVIEDCGHKYTSDITSYSFPEEVVKSVFALSKDKNYDNDTYYKGISYHPIAVIVKLADRYHNLSTLYNFTEEKKAKYIKETEDYVYPLVSYAENHYYTYSSLIRTLDLAIEALVNNIKPYMKKED